MPSVRKYQLFFKCWALMRARLTTDRGGVGREEMICFERQEIVVRCKTPLMVGILFNVPIPSPGGNTGPRHILKKHSLRDRSSLDRIITKKNANAMQQMRRRSCYMIQCASWALKSAQQIYQEKFRSLSCFRQKDQLLFSWNF